MTFICLYVKHKVYMLMYTRLRNVGGQFVIHIFYNSILTSTFNIFYCVFIKIVFIRVKYSFLFI